MSPRATTTPATSPRAAVTALSDPAADASIFAATKILGMPTIRDEHARIADAAVRERLSHKAFLAEILIAECDDRDARRRIRRVNKAKSPRSKRLDTFDTSAIPDLPAATVAHLASGTWIDAGEPLVLLGDSGTGKTHLLPTFLTGHKRTIGGGLKGAVGGSRLSVTSVFVRRVVRSQAEHASSMPVTGATTSPQFSVTF